MITKFLRALDTAALVHVFTQLVNHLHWPF